MEWYTWEAWVHSLQDAVMEELGLDLMELALDKSQLEALYLEYSEPQHAVSAVRELHNLSTADGMVF